MFFECSIESFFFKFFEYSVFIKSFWRLQHSSKDVVLKISAFYSYEKKKPVIRRKDKVIDYANKNPKIGCRVIAEYFSIGNTCFSNILRNTKAVQREYEFFKVNCKKLRHEQYHLIDEIPIAWCKKYASANVFSDGPMLKEEATLIKDRLNKDELLRSLHQMAG